jgi:hypothetical protein
MNASIESISVPWIIPFLLFFFDIAIQFSQREDSLQWQGCGKREGHMPVARLSGFNTGSACAIMHSSGWPENPTHRVGRQSPACLFCFNFPLVSCIQVSPLPKENHSLIAFQWQLEIGFTSHL